MRVNTRSSSMVIAGRCRRSEFKNGVRGKAASQREAVGGAIVALIWVRGIGGHGWMVSNSPLWAELASGLLT